MNKINDLGAMQVQESPSNLLVKTFESLNFSIVCEIDDAVQKCCGHKCLGGKHTPSWKGFCCELGAHVYERGV